MFSHYALLGIQDDATDDQIKAGFKTQCLIWHPDKVINWAKTEEEQATCQQIFQLLEPAKEALLDHEKRATYDLQLKFSRHFIGTTHYAR